VIRGPWGAAAVCAVPRLAALFVHPPSPTQYSALAISLADTHRYVLDGAATARLEPLHPALLAMGRLAFRSFGVDAERSMLVLPIVLASAAGAGLFALTREKANSERAAWIATLLYACSPYLVRQSASSMEITTATALLILAAWRMQDVSKSSRAAAAGLLLGAIVLTRFSFLPIAGGGLLLVWRREGAGRFAAAAAMTALCVLPWAAYSRSVDGSLWPSRVGENLFVSTNEWTAEVIPQTNVDVLVPIATDLVRGEPDPDRALLRRATDYVEEHPFEAAWLKLRNLAFTLQPRLLPFTERAGEATIVDGRLVIPEQRRRSIADRWIAGVFQAILLAGGAAGIWRRRAVIGADGFLLVVLASVIAVNSIFFPTSRLLAPMTFVLMFYTAAALAERP